MNSNAIVGLSLVGAVLGAAVGTFFGLPTWKMVVFWALTGATMSTAFGCLGQLCRVRPEQTPDRVPGTAVGVTLFLIPFGGLALVAYGVAVDQQHLGRASPGPLPFFSMAVGSLVTLTWLVLILSTRGNVGMQTIVKVFGTLMLMVACGTLAFGAAVIFFMFLGLKWHDNYEYYGGVPWIYLIFGVGLLGFAGPAVLVFYLDRNAWRFSLRALLIATTVVAVVLGIYTLSR